MYTCMYFYVMFFSPAEYHGDNADFIRLEDCEPVLEPIYDFIPNQNGCQVKRTMRQDKEMCCSREIGSQAVA